MKGQKIIGAVTVATMLLCQGVFADSVTVTKDTLTEKYTVSGEISEAMSSGKVSFMVVSENDDIAHMRNVETNKEGEFIYNFMMSEDAPSGNYSVKVSAYGRTEPYTVSLGEYYVSATRKAEILEHINTNITTAEQLQAYLSDGVMLEIGITWPKSLTLSAGAKSKTVNDIFVSKPYSELKDLKSVYFENVSVYAMNETTKTNVTAVWEEYEQYFELSGAVMNGVYGGYGDSEKMSAIRKMAGNEILSEADVIKAFNQAVFLNELSKTDGYSDVNALFKKYGIAVPFSLDKFNSLAPVTRGNALSGKDFDKMSDLESAINKIKDSDSGSSSGGGGGGGGGGSSSGGGSTSGNNWGIINQENGEREYVEETVVNYGTFLDIDKNYWAYTAIETLAESGIISGYDDKTFRPLNNVTREEFVAMLVRYMGLELVGECEFDDVPKGRWSYPYIATAYANGIVKGDGGNLFGTDNYITRQDMAVMVARALKFETDEFVDSFNDEAEISDYAKESVKALKKAGIITGFEDNTFKPQNNTSRAETVAVLYKISKGA